VVTICPNRPVSPTQRLVDGHESVSKAAGAAYGGPVSISAGAPKLSGPLVTAPAPDTTTPDPTATVSKTMASRRERSRRFRPQRPIRTPRSARTYTPVEPRVKARAQHFPISRIGSSLIVWERDGSRTRRSLRVVRKRALIGLALLVGVSALTVENNGAAAAHQVVAASRQAAVAEAGRLLTGVVVPAGSTAAAQESAGDSPCSRLICRGARGW
jgi:hypothetical protein